MTKDNYELDDPKPGECFDDYLKRHKAHPSQPDRRAATEEEAKESDVTQARIERGYVIGESNWTLNGARAR